MTDPVIRQNLVDWGHPDGRQPLTTGIALPQWVIEGKNNIWVLGLYGLVFGAALPALVGRWWFGNKEKTKDGVSAKTATAFFKGLKEESTMTEVVGVLAKAFDWDIPATKTTPHQKAELATLEHEISTRLGATWSEVKDLESSEQKLRSLVLLYAHLLRLTIQDASLQKGLSYTLTSVQCI